MFLYALLCKEDINMYIIKNAWRNVCRNLGKNILLGIIAFVIGLSCCLALSIRQAANQQRKEGLDALNITASIGVDRMSVMKQGRQENEEVQNIDPKEMLSQISSLSLDELETYAKAESVKDFYYTKSLSINGEGLEPIESSISNDRPQGMGKGMDMNQSDFTVIGYSSHEAMSDFVNGNATISEGTVFDEDSKDECIISEELATYNNLKLQDQIKLVNPDNEKDVHTFTITGFYTSNATGMEMGRMMSDPANQIYTSVTSLDAIVTVSKEASSDSAMVATVNGTYVFEDLEQYEAFEAQAQALGLSEEYTVSSQDVTQYEQSLQPLVSLSEYATIFLIVILIIGGCILAVLHMYHIRERKYEIGVLAAIGMNKKKISMQFICEIFVVTMVSMLIGSGIGAMLSVPVTNTLLEKTAQTTMSQERGGFGMKQEPEELSKPDEDGFQGVMGKGQQYLMEISSATDVYVVLQVCVVAVLLTLMSAMLAMMSILRYEPLKILSDRE